MNIQCPVCDARLNCAVGNEPPQLNDVTVCVYCKSILQFRRDEFTLLMKFDELPKSLQNVVDNAITTLHRLMDSDETIH